MIKQILYNCEVDCTVLIRKPQVISAQRPTNRTRYYHSRSYLPTNLTTYLLTCLPTYLPTCLPTYLPT